MGVEPPLTGLTNGQTIYWSVQAIDTAFAGGAFAPEVSFVYPPSNASSAPVMSINGTKLTLNSSLPLPFTIYSSTNLSDWEWYANPVETSQSIYEAPLQTTKPVQFFQLRSP